MTIKEHVVLRDAIASRDPRRAREAMKMHLLGAARRLDLTLESY